MIVRIALAAAIALVALPALAAPSVPIVEYRVMGEDERAISVIEGGIKTDAEGHKETVFYIGYAQPVGALGTTQVVSATILFDCQTPRYKIGETSSFTADMTPVGRSDGRFSWRDVVPDSPFGRASAYACKGGELPRADSPTLKKIFAAYLERRAAAAPPAPTAEPAPAAPAEPTSEAAAPSPN